MGALLAIACSDVDRAPYISPDPVDQGGSGTGATGATDATGGAAAAAATGATGATEPGEGGSPTNVRATITQVLKDAQWGYGQHTMGFAVDSTGLVYVQDDMNVYVVDGDVIDVFLTAEEAAGLAGLGYARFQDMDIGPDDQLYISTYETILKTNTAHTAEVWGDYRGPDGLYMIQGKLSVISDDEVLLAADHSLYRLNHSESEVVYEDEENTALKWHTGCACQELTTSRSGVFLYQPGCNGSPIMRGNADGSGVGVLYDSRFGDDKHALNADNFLCSARDPEGGFYVVVDSAENNVGAVLFHLTEDSNESRGFGTVPTAPTLTQAEEFADETFSFGYCSLAVAPDGVVYMQTMSQLWRIVP
jgi:hypothetical protein